MWAEEAAAALVPSQTTAVWVLAWVLV